MEFCSYCSRSLALDAPPAVAVGYCSDCWFELVDQVLADVAAYLAAA